MLAKVTHFSEHASNWDTAKIHRVLGEENLNKIEFVLEDGSFSLCCWGRTGFVSMLQQKVGTKVEAAEGEDRTEMKKKRQKSC